MKKDKYRHQDLDILSEPETSVVLSTQQQRTLLDEQVRKYILKGHSRAETIKYIIKESEKLGCTHTESHAANIYWQVRSEIKHELEENKEYILAELTSKMCYLYKRNLEKEDLKEARECLKEIAKLAGVSNNSSVEINRADETININFG